MGVGTKFLTENILCQEVSLSRNKGEEAERYGRRVRDCHAEVLARRAFRRYLSEEIRRCARQRANEDDSNDIISSILQHVDAGQSDFPRFRLRRGVHVHFYCSSAPCGNSVLKKFATMKKEVFFDDIGENEWPRGPHAAMPGHSIPMGQFALLVKKDNSVPEDTDKAQLRHLANNFYESHRKLTPKSAEWSMNTSVDWCPAGTTTVWSGRGSIHSCSDKICRWNALGLQGGLLSRYIEPIYMETLTVGRKLTRVCCERAVCCRASDNNMVRGSYRLQHPVVMGTDVYVDENAVVDMSDGVELMRFHTFDCFVWWKGCGELAECIDGSTGFVRTEPGSAESSAVSTTSLTGLFLAVTKDMHDSVSASTPRSLLDLHSLKRTVATEYEEAKDELITKNKTLRDWKRRTRYC